MRNLIGLAVFCAVISTPAMAENHAVGARIGLLGLGLEYSYRFNDRITVRTGLNGSGLGFNETESGIDYAFDLDFDSLSVGVDVHPLKGKFRVSVGALQNDSSLSATGILAQNVMIDDTTYQAVDIGTLRGVVGFDSTAPYFAVGFDWLHDKKFGVALDIGVLKQGSPFARLSADGPISSDPGFVADLAAEQAELQQSLDDFDMYPYVMFGVVMRF